MYLQYVLQFLISCSYTMSIHVQTHVFVRISLHVLYVTSTVRAPVFDTTRIRHLQALTAEYWCPYGNMEAITCR